jgi:hypothetical protein
MNEYKVTKSNRSIEMMSYALRELVLALMKKVNLLLLT